MSTTQPTLIPSPEEGQDLAKTPMRFEVTTIPVTDVDRAKAFYQRLGWRVDMEVVLNQADRLDGSGAGAARDDLGRLLAADGLDGVPVHLVSARTGQGLEELRSAVRKRAAARSAAVERLS